jgi:hypothetical protein
MASNGVTTSFTYDAWGRMTMKNATIGEVAREVEVDWIESLCLGGFV